MMSGNNNYKEKQEKGNNVYSDEVEHLTIGERELFLVGTAHVSKESVNLVKQVREKRLRLGKDIGIISYNDTPLKELLGITVISTDFKVMGETAADMILANKKDQVRNVFRFMDRNSV